MKLRTFIPTFMLVALGVFITGYVALAISGIGNENGTFLSRTLIDASTSSATSSTVTLANARSASFEFSSDGPNGAGNGTSTFSVQVSVDGSTYYTYPRLYTNEAPVAATSSVKLTATTSNMFFADFRGESFLTARCISVESGTTTATCKVLVQY